jgi:hypothetical protein
VVQSIGRLDEAARSRLYRLDLLLNELEALNLADSTLLPQEVAADLQDAGVQRPAERSVTELIDQVFELQEPILALIASFGRRRLSASNDYQPVWTHASGG